MIEAKVTEISQSYPISEIKKKFNIIITHRLFNTYLKYDYSYKAEI